MTDAGRADAPADQGWPLDHVVIYASDPVRSVAFYECLLERLGFTKAGGRVLRRGTLFFDIRPAGKRGTRAKRDPGVDHFGFKAGSRRDVDRVRDAMGEAGHDAGRLIEFDNGDYAAFFTDPDGLRIELTCYENPAAPPVD